MIDLKSLNTYAQSLMQHYNSTNEYVVGVKEDAIYTCIKISREDILKMANFGYSGISNLLLRGINILRKEANIGDKWSGKFTIHEFHHSPMSDDIQVYISFKGQSLDKYWHDKEFNNKYLENIND